MRYWLGILLLSLSAGAVQKEGVEFAATHTAGAEQLQLVGVGVRKAERFGISFRVYVAGLYVSGADKTADAVEKAGSKYIQMRFLRRVDKSSMVEAWTEGMYKNCVADCEHYRDQIRPVTDMMVDILDKGQIELLFQGDKVTLDIEGREKKHGEFKGANLAKNLIRVFIGPKPSDPELKKGLLGL